MISDTTPTIVGVAPDPLSRLFLAFALSITLALAVVAAVEVVTQYIV